jgi:hypothetical protein
VAAGDKQIHQQALDALQWHWKFAPDSYLQCNNVCSCGSNIYYFRNRPP